MATIASDFKALAELLQGELEPRQPVPPERKIVRKKLTTAAEVYETFRNSEKWLGLDTEGLADNPWGLTYSLRPWYGYCIRTEDSEALGAFRKCLAAFTRRGGKLLIHNAMHDLDVLLAMQIDLPDGSYIDTMVLAYLLGILPQGLKPLSYREWDIHMNSYDDVVGTYDLANVQMYFQMAMLLGVDDCPNCGARPGRYSEHPVGGYEHVPQAFQTKGGTILAKFQDWFEMCDGGGPKPDRRWTMSRYIEKALEDSSEKLGT